MIASSDDVTTPGNGRTLKNAHPDECLPGWRNLIEGADEEAVVVRYGQTLGLGKRPALLMIDFQIAYMGRNAPLLPQLAEYPASSGDKAWNAFAKAMDVLAAARLMKLPVYVTRVAFDPKAESGVSFAGKRSMPSSFEIGSEYTQLPEELRLREGEELVNKSGASAFYGTNLDAFIAEHEIDSLMVTGLSTSGCVRSTVVDAAARRIKPTVVVDAVGDRLSISHRVALLDIWMKYGDLCTSAAVTEWAKG